MKPRNCPLTIVGDAGDVTIRNSMFVGFKHCLRISRGYLGRTFHPDTSRITVVDNVVTGECGTWECSVRTRTLTFNGDAIANRELPEGQYDVSRNIKHSNPYKG